MISPLDFNKQNINIFNRVRTELGGLKFNVSTPYEPTEFETTKNTQKVKTKKKFDQNFK